MEEFAHEQFLEHCAAKRGLSVPEFRQWMEEADLVVVPCACGYEGGANGAGVCRGWQVTHPDRTRPRRRRRA